MYAWWSRVKGVRPLTVLAIGLAGLVLYGFPGYMSNDSFVQLMEARKGYLTDAHPPLMAFEWGLLDRVISGPLLMLVLQGVLALWGLFAILRTVLAPRRAGVVAVAILWFPPVLTTFGVIWKDSQMAAYMLAGIGCLVDRRQWMRVLGLFALAAGCAMRHNALAGVVPVIGLLFVWAEPVRWWKRYLISGAVSIAVVVAAFTTSHVLADEHVPISPATIDIVGVLAYADPIDDAKLRDLLRDTPLFTTEHIQAKAQHIFTPRNPFWYDHGPDRMFDLSTTDAQRAALMRAWKQLIPSHLMEYLSYRLEVFRGLIGDSPWPVWSPVWTEHYEMAYQPAEMKHAASRSPLQTEAMLDISWLGDHTPIFRAYMYLWIGLLVLLLCARDRLSIAILASGLLYELAYFPVVATPDFRYSHWMITCVVCACVLVFVRRYRRT